MKKKINTVTLVLLAAIIIACSPIKASATMVVVEAPVTAVSSVAKFDGAESKHKEVKPVLLKNIKKLVSKVKK
ncbi:hypothetical protein MHH70_09080 [Metasolibacillus sp. FSL H7-0170]|uniref:hypothetical protein n=1 Tax=Metasolibacillus sp. FSL H7-0170 TaxID=2921431 RepID=UPI00079C2C96|nr:hypothetical protein A0U40_08030 [[Bacillus] sp. KCTC 13219]